MLITQQHLINRPNNKGVTAAGALLIQRNMSTIKALLHYTNIKFPAQKLAALAAEMGDSDILKRLQGDSSVDWDKIAAIAVEKGHSDLLATLEVPLTFKQRYTLVVNGGAETENEHTSNHRP